MPLELEFRKTAGSSYGTVNEVCQAVAAALPETRFWKDPPGAVFIQKARDQGTEFPTTLREHLEKTDGSYQGTYEGNGFSLEFWFGSSELVDSFLVNVRGTGDSLKAVAIIATCTGWKAIYLATGTEVTEADWHGFQGWRDKSIKKIKGEQGAPPNAGSAASVS